MKYLTKEYYEACGYENQHHYLVTAKAAGVFSETYFQLIYEREWKKFLKERLEIRDIMAEHARTLKTDEAVQMMKNFDLGDGEYRLMFERSYQDGIRYWNHMLPSQILRQIPDIRILSLRRISKENRGLIREFCREKGREVKSTQKRYMEYRKGVLETLPEPIRKNFSFHDSTVLAVTETNGDLILEMRSGGYSDCVRLTFVDAEIETNEWKENAIWIYEEIYPLEYGYEFHALLFSNDWSQQLHYLIVKAADVKFEF